VTQEKILSLDDLATRLAEQRRRGERVVLANGCFDLLHVGHIRYLEGAKALGGVLVVGVNSDASVAQLKGPGRPLLAAADRARLVAALRAVDYVVVFDAPTVAGLLERLKPDFHAKGTDYTPDSVPERDTAARVGCQVAIVGDPKQHSTRDLLGEILRRFRR
jgi:rfaE bifunctional protein nucleotidyltransferase chain/domain